MIHVVCCLSKFLIDNTHKPLSLIFVSLFPASVGDQDSCDTQNATYLTAAEGYISSTALNSNYFGTSKCPFTVKVQPGQRIYFEIQDFTLKDNAITISPSATGLTCAVSGIFTDSIIPREIDLCQGSYRQRDVFTSRTDSVTVYFELAKPNLEVPLFFLRYEGNQRPWKCSAPEYLDYREKVHFLIL